MKKSILIMTLISFMAVFALAGNLNSIPPLERTISVDFNNLSVDKALEEIASKADISFSYNPQKIPLQKKVKLQINEKPVRWVLDNMFEGEVKYKTKGDYVILQKNRLSNTKMEPPKELRLSGYVLDAITGEKVSGVSLFDTISFHSVLTNEHGHFEFVLHPETKAIALFIKKEGYLDTSIFIEKTGFKLFLIGMTPIPPTENTYTDSVVMLDSMNLVADSSLNNDSWLDIHLKEEVPKAIKKIKELFDDAFKLNAENIKDTFHRSSQVSFLPGISTNHKMSTQVVNDYSFNILGGYTGGTNIFEIGGLFNISKGNVSYAQIAGLTNIVEGNVFGAQVAGITNIVKKDFLGAQVAGLANFNGGKVEGGQFAGIFNTCSDLYGVQVSGLVNSASKSVYGAQVAGIFNTSKKVYGGQFSGIMNRAESVYGVQVASFLNKAKYVQGTQIGFINLSDSINGLSIGFFNFVKHGYHKLEFAYNDIQQAQISFRTGTRLFHNIFSFSMEPDFQEPPIWSFSYGLGSSFKLANRLSLDIDLNASHIEKGKFDLNLSDRAQLYLGLDLHFTKKFSLAFGPTFNLYLLDQTHPDFAKGLSTITAKPLFSETVSASNQMIGWFGAKVAIRFF